MTIKGDPTRIPHVSEDQVRHFYLMLPIGRDNAIIARDLADVLGIDSSHADRILRALAEAAINDYGLLVSTGQTGYYKPANREEAHDSIRWVASQALRMLTRVRAVEALIDTQFATESGRDPLTFNLDIAGEDVALFPEALPSTNYRNGVKR